MKEMENHVVCIPFPAQGHIRPMLKLAQLLHYNFGFHITFINTHHIHQTYFQNHHSSSSSSSSSSSTPIFRFESLPQGIDDSNDLHSLINSIVNNKLEQPLKELLMSKLVTSISTSTSTSNTTSSTCSCVMITDVAMSSFTLRVAQELGIRAVVFETTSACAHLAYYYCRKLLDKGIIPLQDQSCLTNGYLEKEIDWIPSLKGIYLKDMPTCIRTTDPNDMWLNVAIANSHRALNNCAILINTFETLEQDVLRELSTISPNIYPIGPLHLMVEHHIPKKDIISFGPPKCEEDKKNDEYVMKWLDSQEPKSVLYVSFGTLVGLTQETIMELTWGLACSHSDFLLIIRSDLVIGECNSIDFDRFKKDIDGRGLLVEWCDQERVLSHPSIGGFLTHCGWNSTIESISNGVPMICWPNAADQVTNSWYCCNALGIGVKMSNEEVTRDVIERVVIELMQKEKGKDIKAKAMKWSKMAREAVKDTQGCSYANLKNVVDNVLKVQQ